MIAICEPLCKGSSHEKVNSGFIYGLRLAFPEQKIRLYADTTHMQAIQSILTHDQVVVENIEYVPIRLPSMSLIGLIRFYFLLKRIFREVLASDSEKVFFFSFSSALLSIIKTIKKKGPFRKIKFTFVLHSAFESIAGHDRPPSIQLERETLETQSVYRKIASTRPTELASQIYRSCFDWDRLNARLFPERKILLQDQSADFRYIALSHHIIPNAKKYIDVDALNIFTVVHPMNFEEMTPAPKNEFIKFAIFGFGNPLMLQNVMLMLSRRELKNRYEIRIIGMDRRGTEGFAHVTCPGPKRRLQRSEMSSYASDIDVFLILYPNDRFRLSCSASIFESLSYCKPTLHFDNECISPINDKNCPIGYCCNTVEEFVDKMQDLIENYPAYNLEFQDLRKNIVKLRDEYSVENSVDDIRKSFTWA